MGESTQKAHIMHSKGIQKSPTIIDSYILRIIILNTNAFLFYYAYWDRCCTFLRFKIIINRI